MIGIGMDQEQISALLKAMEDELRSDSCMDEDEAGQYCAGLLNGWLLAVRERPKLEGSNYQMFEAGGRELVRKALAFERELLEA